MSEAISKDSVSVVIPILNEENYIHNCLDSILSQDYPVDLLEIVLVDGFSTDRTAEIIKEYMLQYPFIKLLGNPHKTVQYALNIGILGATNDIIVRMDAHSQYAKDYISQCVHYLNATGVFNVGGPTVVRGKTYLQKVIAAAYHSPFALGGGKCHIEEFEGEADTVSFGCYRREKILELGLYDERFPRSEDDELNLRASTAGEKIFITPKIKSTYYPRSSYGALFEQYFGYGLWKPAVIKKHKRPSRISHLIPMAFVLFLFFGALFSCLSTVCLYCYLGVLAFYLLLDSYFSFINPHVHSLGERLHLVAVHFILHLSYGLGFLLGIWKFLLRNELDM